MTVRTAQAIGLLVAASTLGCADSPSSPSPLLAEMPLHLGDHLSHATSEGFSPVSDLPQAIEWRFEEPQSPWKVLAGQDALRDAGGSSPAAPRLEATGKALLVHFDETNRDEKGDLWGFIYVELPDLTRSDWGDILVRVRSTDPVRKIGLAFNLATEEDQESGVLEWRFSHYGEEAVFISDGEVNTYRLRADWSGPWFGEWQDPWRELGIWMRCEKPATVAVLSVTLLPAEAAYASAPFDARTVVRGERYRRAIMVHSPGALSFSVRIPEAGRFDFSLGVLLEDDPVTFRVALGGDPAKTLFEEVHADPDSWAQRSVDLADHAGRTVELRLEVESENPGSVAFWGVPILSGPRTAERPNVIFYVIDGGGADLMSVYGYDRSTTPVLSSLAAEGTVFERAYTNSAWTKPSTASFMTSLHHSVLGGFGSTSDQIPDRAATMAEHFRGAGYQTAVFTSNPFAGSLSGLERGVDVFRDAGAEPNSTSSAELHAEFWDWREAYPAEPYWVHFQTTDVHEPHRPTAPFAGLFIEPERRETFYEWWRQLHRMDGPRGATILGYFLSRLESMGVDSKRFFDTQRGLYDETMAHNDYQLGRLIEQLKQRGEWERTLLIIAADHGHPAGSFSRFGRGLIEPPPPESEGALADSYRAHIPMIFVWPARIPGGRRLSQQVSMIDMLPTLLDLVGLPEPEVSQGQSLAPLLLRRDGWEPRPVILDQFQVELGSGELAGHIEVIDGRWIASLEIIPESVREEYEAGNLKLHTAGGWRSARPHWPDTPRLLLYDAVRDPFCTRNVNAEHPQLVEKYTRFLEARWTAHRTLAKQFQRSDGAPLNPQQLETLRALGYAE